MKCCVERILLKRLVKEYDDLIGQLLLPGYLSDRAQPPLAADDPVQRKLREVIRAEWPENRAQAPEVVRT